MFFVEGFGYVALEKESVSISGIGKIQINILKIRVDDELPLQVFLKNLKFLGIEAEKLCASREGRFYVVQGKENIRNAIHNSKNKFGSPAEYNTLVKQCERIFGKKAKVKHKERKPLPTIPEKPSKKYVPNNEKNSESPCCLIL